MTCPRCYETSDKVVHYDQQPRWFGEPENKCYMPLAGDSRLYVRRR